MDMYQTWQEKLPRQSQLGSLSYLMVMVRKYLEVPWGNTKDKEKENENDNDKDEKGFGDDSMFLKT